jgi:hypothetical protein
MSMEYENLDIEDSLRNLARGNAEVLRSDEKTTLSIVTFEGLAKPSYFFGFGNSEVYDPVTEIRAKIQKLSEEDSGQSFVLIDFETSSIIGRFSQVINESKYTLYPFFNIRLTSPDEFICLHTVNAVESGSTRENMNVISKNFNARQEFGAGGVWGVTNLNNTAPPSPPWNQCALRI